MLKRKIWRLATPISKTFLKTFSKQITPLQAQLLSNRGITGKETIDKFLSPRLDTMADPMLLKGMSEAIDIIISHVLNNKKILIYGDYDADGLTATALLQIFFTEIGFPVLAFSPNRFQEGYGLNPEAIKRFAKTGVNLIITVDCGVSNYDEIILAENLGIQVVITDHHQVPDDFGFPCPLINPHQPNCSYPFKDLAGVGVAFLLAVAIRSVLRKKGWFTGKAEPNLREYLDLVALGTVADRVPLMDQNRIFVKSGMEIMTNSRWSGIRALQQVLGLYGKDISSDDLGFRMAPRVNAPGRMGDPQIALELLTVTEESLAMELALKVSALNEQRQKIEKQILDRIEALIEEEDSVESKCLFFYGDADWHLGVLGIVASRLVDKYNRPAFIYNIRDGLAVGSARSIDGFHLYQKLSQMGKNVLERFGGHSHAAGFTVKIGNLDILKTMLEESAVQSMGTKNLPPILHIDSEIRLNNIGKQMLKELSILEPFGESNQGPLFLVRSVEIMDARVVGDKHLKLKVRQDGETFEAIGFGLGDRYPLIANSINMVFTPEINYWKGKEQIQLRVVDLN